jgi:hypothetical protein
MGEWCQGLVKKVRKVIRVKKVWVGAWRLARGVYLSAPEFIEFFEWLEFC